MKINATTVLVGERVLLVPYLAEHVPLYNAWMQSPELLELTASEPLTLEEEYENQISWREDEQKLTFIILDRSRPDSPNISTKGGAMVGDVNLFFNDYEDEHAAEIEIMIADSESRGKGLGPEAVRLMMAYGVHRLNVSQYIVKIGASNQKSINMFKTLGFDQFEYLEWCDEQHGKYVIDRSADLNTTFPLQERQLGDVL